MPYVLLAVGLLLALYGLYKFMIVATPKQAGALILAIFTLVVAGALLVLTLTGRLPAALAILLALWPLALSFWKRRQKPVQTTNDKPMNREEALAILGLPDGADEGSIQEAYKRLMMKIHPDQQGSEWMAAKLNAARDYLLK